MLRKVLISVLVFIVMLSLDSASSIVNAIPMGYGGPTTAPSLSLLSSNITFFSGGPDPRVAEEVATAYQLADSGIKLRTYLVWSDSLFNQTALDVFYNESCRKVVEEYIDQYFDEIDPEKIWAVIIGHEEPSASFEWAGGSPSAASSVVKRYSDVYLEETGFQLKSEMNETEWIVFHEWINEKAVWAINYVYDYVKSRWPHLQLFQFVGMAGAAWLAYDIIAPYELKADGFVMDWYSQESWLLYDCVRRYKATLPDKEFHMVLWGTQSWPWEGELGGFEPIRRHAWTAYLAGADAIEWFTWHPTEGWAYERKDPLGQRLYMYTDRLNRELSKLPALRPRPQVLCVGGEWIYLFGEPSSFQEFLAFTEYDAVNQRFFATSEMDLSRYRLIVVAEHTYFDETVRKLNDYVADGGNVIFLAGTGWNDRNIYGNDTRERFLIEENAVQSVLAGHIRINISKPNILDVEMNYDGQFHETFALQIEDPNGNYHPIGNFYMIDEDGTERKTEEHPFVLYQNRSNPNSGWILYWGAVRSSRTPGVTGQNYGDYQILEDHRDMKFLHKEVFRAFANFLNMSSSVSTEETENVIITQSKLDDGSILVGMLNFNFEDVNITYSLDLECFGLPDGEYWVHSLDENTTVGRFESYASKLEMPVVLQGKDATKLYLISQEKPEPAYSVDVSPEIPSVDDIEIYEEPQLLLPQWSYGIEEKEPYSQVWSVSISSDGEYIAAGSIDNMVRLFDRSGGLLWSRETGDHMYSVAISSDGDYVAAGSRDNNVYFFDKEGNLLWSHETGLAVHSVSISSDGGYIAAGSEDRNVYFLDRSGSLLWSYETEGGVECVSISSDGGYVAAGSWDGNVCFFDRSGTLLWSYETGDRVPSVSISSDGGYVAAGSYDSRVYFFDRAGNLLWDYEARWIVGHVSISSDGEYIAVASLDAYVYFFDRSGRLLWEYETGLAAFGVSMSSDGSYVGVGSCDFNLYLFNRSGSRLWYKTGADVMSVSISSDGNYIAAGSDDHNVYFFSSTLPPLQATTVLSTQTATQGEPVTISTILNDDAETPIEGATVMATVLYLEVLVLLSDKGNGNYQGSIDTSDFTEGTYNIIVTAQKEGYKSAQTTMSLTVRTPIPWMSYMGAAIAVTTVVIIAALVVYLTKKRSRKLTK
jgi:WD40 repeat protein